MISTTFPRLLPAALLLGLLSACGGNTATVPQHTTSPTTTQMPKADARKKVLFFGDSLTAGFGLAQEQSFPSLLQARIDSLQLPYECVNAGVSGETSAGGLARVEWVLSHYPIEVFVLELGANDGLRGIDPASTAQNLQGIIDKVREQNPQAQIILAGMLAPPNMGKEYTQRFGQMYRELAQKNKLALIPFLLDKVAGNPALNQADGIHPTADGARIVAENVWTYLQPALQQQS